VLLTTLKLFAPFLPYVTDEVYRRLFAEENGAESIHCSQWPTHESRFEDENLEAFGETLVGIATAVRRYKSERNLSLGTRVARLQLATEDAGLSDLLRAATLDIASITRAQQIEIVVAPDSTLEILPAEGAVRIALDTA
jgi:valyl-tRNA synthetase